VERERARAARSGSGDRRPRADRHPDQLAQTRAALSAAPLRAMPLFVLTHGRPAPGSDPRLVKADERLWRKLQDELAALVPKSKHLIANGAATTSSTTSPNSWSPPSGTLSRRHATPTAGSGRSRYGHSRDSLRVGPASLVAASRTSGLATASALASIRFPAGPADR
jgi:hypothetical protein